MKKAKRSTQLHLIMLSLWMAATSIGYAQDTLWIFTFPSDSNVSVTVHSSVTSYSGGYTYNYSLTSATSSEQNVEGFFIDHGSSIDSIASPNQWLGEPSGLPSEISHSIMWGSLDSLADIFPGVQLGGFKITSSGLPSVYRFYAKGFSETPILDGEPDSLIGGDVFENSFKGLTIAPKDPPLPFNSLAFLDTIKTNINQSRTLGWITDDPTANKYTAFIDSARYDLLANRHGVTKSKLDLVLQNVDTDSGNTLSSEAYALLRFNTEYVLKKLREYHKEH
jgi:hypothetical protein